jgi:putative transcriptional regulator
MKGKVCGDFCEFTLDKGHFITGERMKEQLHLKNHLKEARTEANLSQAQLAEMVGVSRNTISSIETGQFNPTAKLALILCIALDKKFEDLFFF